jgi:hypothetical protein
MNRIRMVSTIKDDAERSQALDYVERTLVRDRAKGTAPIVQPVAAMWCGHSIEACREEGGVTFCILCSKENAQTA